MKSFNEVYEKICRESSEELEILRKNRVKKFALCIGIPIIAFIIICILRKIEVSYVLDYISDYILATLLVSLLVSFISFAMLFYAFRNKKEK